MPKNTNRYRGAAEREARNRRAAVRTSGRFGPAGRRLGTIRAHVHRPHPRREIVIVGSFLLAVIVGLGSLGLGLYMSKADHDWASVATVNSRSVNREELRGRIAVLGLLGQERSQFIDAAASGGNLAAEQAPALQNAAAAVTSLEAARDSLIDDDLLRQLASRDGIAAPASPDPWTEATAYVSGDFAHRLRFVRFGLPTATTGAAPSPATPGPAPGGSTTPSEPWPAASTTNSDATTARVRAELMAATPIETIVARLHDAGWQVFGEDVAVSADGVSADASLELDPTVAAATTRGKPGDLVGPATDAYGRVSIGKLIDPPDKTTLSRRLPFDADKAKVDTAALQSWANGQALRHAVTASLLTKWGSAGVNEAHFRELVIGAAPTSGGAGPWVELSALVVDRLKGVSPASIAGAPSGLDLTADGLAKALKSMTPTDRTALFRGLVASANRPPVPDTTNTSGELGFYTKDGLVPDLGAAAFDEKTHTGDVIGPTSTSAGPELFLVESHYAGTLDERSQVALRQVRNDPAPDLLAYTKQYSPADAALAADAGWRAEPEFGSSEAVRAALFDTPIGTLSDPFVLDGKLALALVTERRTAVPDARTQDRLTLDGYDAWFASEYAKAAITRSDSPLPELMPSAGPSPSASAAPALPSMPALDTPNLPAIPGQPAATPVRTDQFGLPALP
jgi:hypothetical protein